LTGANAAPKQIKEGMMQGSETLVKMLPYLVPLVVLEVALVTVSLVDLARRQHVTGGRKIIWVAVILGLQGIGPVVYLVAGRKEKEIESE
jgi:hypothetical protein